jgi:hypothetical protein
MIEDVLRDQVVGISISEPDDLESLGLGEVHLDHAFIEFVRHVFAAGGSISYGGDFRKGGFTDQLFDLLRAYRRQDRPAPSRVLNFHAWPTVENMPTSVRATRGREVTLVPTRKPPGAPETLADPGRQSATERLWFAISLREMRLEMSNRIQARVIFGGRTWGAMGLVPGVAEEAAYAVVANKPLYPAGGFGGCAKLIADALHGQNRPELTVSYQLTYTDKYGELLEASEKQGVPNHLKDIASIINSITWNDLNNGLDLAENKRLVRTDDIEEFIALFLTGMRRLHT